MILLLAAWFRFGCWCLLVGYGCCGGVLVDGDCDFLPFADVLLVFVVGGGTGLLAFEIAVANGNIKK